MVGETENLELIHGDARHLPLADGSVQCIVTSPPYWGLRKYAGDQGVEPYGLEPTVEMYVTHTLEILQECWRVLRLDGVLFWNIGDSYARNSGKGQHKPGDAGKQNYVIENGGGRAANQVHLRSESKGSSDGVVGRADRAPVRIGGDDLKPKDLCLVPARVALAAQAAGWWVRSMIVWAKSNPLPESVTDRPTDTYEYILMFTKSEHYFWDADAVREPSTGNTHSRGMGDGGPKARARAADGVYEDWTESTREVLTYRNMRNVWTFATQPYSGAHFATFPEELPRRCILAATSARGACVQCGAPWERVTRDPVTSGKSWNSDVMKSQGINCNENNDFAGSNFYKNYSAPQTIGWRPTCLCPGQNGKTAPCLVLDPFGGSGTTGRVALELRRRAVLVDIAYNAEYRELAERRTSGVNVNLPFL